MVLRTASCATRLSMMVTLLSLARKPSAQATYWMRRRRLMRQTSPLREKRGWATGAIEKSFRAIREGIGRDGRELQEHPANHYSVMTDEDVSAIIAYLRSLRRSAARYPEAHHRCGRPSGYSEKVCRL